MRQRALLWLIPILVTIHDAEEALFMRAGLDELAARMPAQLRSLIPVVTYRQFLLAVVIVTLLPYVLMLLHGRDRTRRVALLMLLTFQMTMLVNVFAHVAATVLLDGYAPGLVTALVLNLPFSVYLFTRAVRAQWVGRRVVAMLIPIALLVHGPGLFGLLWLAGWLSGHL